VTTDPSVEVGCRGAGRVSRTLRTPCTLHIGSSSACDLLVVARGVRARHLALEWDGALLTIVEETESGLVRIDGRAVRPPFVISGSVRLQIGDAEVHATAPRLLLEDEPTLVLDRDRTEVPPGRSDGPTEVSVRPPPPFDATTTQRVRHHRSRLDPVCGSFGAVEGGVRTIAKSMLARLRRRIVPVAVGVSLVAVGLVLPRFSRRAAPARASAPAAVAPSGPLAPPAPVAQEDRAVPSIPLLAPSAAALLLASGRRDEAADAYAALAKARPEDPSFGVVARILGREKKRRAPLPNVSPGTPP
jgi:hypothetical protein